MFFKYSNMDPSPNFLDDERFIYSSELPEAFTGLDLSKVDPMQAQELLKQEQIEKNLPVSEGLWAYDWLVG